MPHSAANRANHPRSFPLRYAVIAVFVVFALLITIASALAAPVSISAPASINEGQALTIVASGPGTIAILRDAIPVATGTGTATYSSLTNSTSAGTVSFTATSTDPGTTASTVGIAINDVPLNVAPLSPASDSAAGAVPFAVRTNWQPEFCYVTIDGTSHTLTPTPGDPTLFNSTFSLADGVHSVEYKCKLGGELPAVTRSLRVDTAAPVVTATSPSGETQGPYLTLTADTNELASCRYGTADAAFAQLPNAMSGGYVYRNTATLSLPDFGSYTFYVRCQDLLGNTMPASAIIGFLNRAPPIAHITIEGDEPLRADTYTLRLTTSVPLQETPMLTSTLQESGKTQQIALTGSGTAWEGYLIIPDAIEDTVISFAFSGLSTNGVRGTEVSTGRLFTVDAMPPTAPAGLSIEASSDRIHLRWADPEEDDAIASYIIYRAGHESVTTADLHATTTTTQWIDASPHGATYLYYRVAAVDEAGNVGPLSEEVQGTAIKSLIVEQDIAIDPIVATLLDEEIATLSSILMSANKSVLALETAPGSATIQIIDDLRLIDKARAASLSIEAARDRLGALRRTNPSRETADAAIADARRTVIAAQADLPQRITPKSETETRQPSDLSSIERNLPYALIGATLDGKERDAYLQSSIAAQDQATIVMTAKQFTIQDSNGEVTDYTFVRKHIKLTTPQRDIRVIEYIPKTVAEDVAELTFSQDPVVLEQDPVIQYSYPVIEDEKFTYLLAKAVSMEELKRTRTILYPAVPAPAAPETTPQEPAPVEGITGYSILGLGEGKLSADALLIILGGIIIAALVFYYFRMDAGSVVHHDTRSPPHAPMPPVHSAHHGPPHAPIIRKAIAAVPVRTPNGASRHASSPRPPAAPHTAHRSAIQDPASLLATAEAAIDDRDFTMANSAYRRALHDLSHDDGLRAMLEEPLDRVYQKLVFYRTMAHAQDALHRKDAKRAHAALEQAKAMAERIDAQETRLMREAKDSYAAFVADLNRLRIEEANY
jgi:hypothetical protein